MSLKARRYFLVFSAHQRSIVLLTQENVIQIWCMDLEEEEEGKEAEEGGNRPLQNLAAVICIRHCTRNV